MEKSNPKARQNKASTHKAKTGPLFCRATARLSDFDLTLCIEFPRLTIHTILNNNNILFLEAAQQRNIYSPGRSAG
ncbi:hypothetical protein, partial [Lentimicrobium sp. S6]|uniref:hypothetical protein n=1 Tax=Lentimicrobium sp. S6 TaxID=2735872 RepID=UPI001C12D8CD